MPRWYLWLWAAAVLGGVLCQFGDLVLWTSLATAMMGFFVWIAAANLWVLAILATPAAWFWNRGRRGLGVALSFALALGIGLGVEAMLRSARAVVVSENLQTLRIPVTSLPVSVEFDESLAGSFDSDVGCDTLCRQLLSGGAVSWVRMPDRGYGLVWVYYLGQPSECPTRKPARACIRSRADIGASADLRVTRVSVPPKSARREGDWVWATFVARLLVRDQDQARLVAVESAVGWDEMRPFPIFPAFAPFNGAPARGAGLIEGTGGVQMRPLPEVLSEIGLRLGPP